MKALLLHDTTPDDVVADTLTGAGHEVVRCNPTGNQAFPCVGVTGRCPLDGTVDVAVVVHDHPTTGFDAGEIGAICAVRDGIPLVLAGTGAASPLQEVATAVATCVQDLESACQRAMHARDARLGRMVRGHVKVERGHVEATLPAWSTTADVVRAHRMLGDAVPAAQSIDVGVTPR
jgi:hypothetical protein